MGIACSVFEWDESAERPPLERLLADVHPFTPAFTLSFEANVHSQEFIRLGLWFRDDSKRLVI